MDSRRGFGGSEEDGGAAHLTLAEGGDGEAD